MRALRLTPAILVALAACGGQQETSPRRSDGAPLLGVLAAPAAPAMRELRTGRLAEARAQLEEALAKDPDEIAALNDLAVSYSMEERFDAARHLLEEVLARGGPREQQAALVNLSELYALDGYLSAALAHLASAKTIDPGRPEPSYGLALLADAQGDRAGSRAALREALEADRGGVARRELAFLYTEERLHLEALLAEASGDVATAGSRWRELVRGRFPVLVQTGQRHLEELERAP
jgi:tetratricopeptide (TPR) repeat protein